MPSSPQYSFEGWDLVNPVVNREVDWVVASYFRVEVPYSSNSDTLENVKRTMFFPLCFTLGIRSFARIWGTQVHS